MLIYIILFIVFLTIIGGIYFFIPKRWRWMLLLVSSYLFYISWNPENIFIILFTTLFSFTVAFFMGKTDNKRYKQIFLFIGLIVSLGPLFYFKYFNYISYLIVRSGYLISGELINRPQIELINPIGISFYTMQVVGYLLDVYRGVIKPEPHIGRYALFVSFFPQLVSGPITSARKMFIQFRDSISSGKELIEEGAYRIMLGGFQKFVIADRLSSLVSKIFENPSEYHSILLILTTYLYYIQIYSDFAGYSNIAVGVGKIFGITLPENFNFPFRAKDAAEFWNRWHISLSNWLRDYIFFPTTRLIRKKWKNKNSLANIIIPPMTTMLVSGFWHGAGTTFIIWGIMHGVMLILSNQTSAWRRNKIEKQGKLTQTILNGLQTLITFNLISFSWVMFKAANLDNGLLFYKTMFQFNQSGLSLGPFGSIIIVLVLGIFLLLEYAHAKDFDRKWLRNQGVYIQAGFYTICLFLFLFLGEFQGSELFIYAQF